MINIPTFGPKCPNHGEYLEGCGFPLPKKGTGTCPISGCAFEFEIETDEAVDIKNKDGSVGKAVGWKITGHE